MVLVQKELKNAYIGELLPTSITLDKSSISLNTVGQTEQLTATVEPEDAPRNTVTWSSDDTSIATVSSSGLVTCVTPGTCTITATTVNGLTASCSVAAQGGWQPGADTIAYYPLKGNLNDYSGNGYNAENTGGTITYPNNEYANFSAAYARFSNGYSSGTTTDDITISLWAKDITLSGGEGNMFVMGQDGFGSGWGALIRAANSNNDYSAYIVTGGALQVTSSYNVSSGVRHHFVQTVSPTNGQMKFYIDGVLKETVSINSSMRIDGKSAIGKAGNYSHSVNGNLSEIINERKARTAQEVFDYYNQTKANYGL